MSGNAIIAKGVMPNLMRRWLMVALVAGCGAGAPAPAERGEPGAGSGSPLLASADKPEGSGELCDGGGLQSCEPPSAGERSELAGRIEATTKIVEDTSFADVDAIVEVARLELLRDGDEVNAVGESDAASALKNGMRAVAVNDSHAGARIVLALAVARSLEERAGHDDPARRSTALSLIDIGAQAIPQTTPETAAVAKVLSGAAALERGDEPSATKAFDAATRLDARLAAAWIGLGDVARVRRDFAAAEAAYRRAATLAPHDRGVRRALGAAERRVALTLPRPAVASLVAVGTGALAPAPPPVAPCPPAAARDKSSAELCRGVAMLASAATPDDKRAAALVIMAGWSELQQPCSTHERQCGPFVASALAAAARAFRSTGVIAKAIAVGRLLIGRPDLPGNDSIIPAMTLEIADAYFALAVFDMAASHYALHAKTTGAARAEIIERALALYVALGQAEDAATLAEQAAPRKQHPAAQRARWLLAAAATLRSAHGGQRAMEWMGAHRALVDEGGLGNHVAAAVAPLDGRRPSCGSFLGCTVRRLAAAEGWTRPPGSAQAP
jgi:tetratricopeptide (TPR) repeat protein